MKNLLYVFALLPVLSFAAEDIHVAMYDEAYPTNDSVDVAILIAKIESLPPTAAGPLKEFRDCNNY